MGYREQLLAEAHAAIAELPSRKREIIDLFTLAVSEIECGESEANEYELFTSSVDAIRKESIRGE
jgi:hypothetical protein